MAEVSAAQRQELEKYQDKIEFSPRVLEHLGGLLIVGVTGPSAVGTTTLINETGLYKVPGFTTRPPRYEGEDEIKFRTHTPEVIDEIIDQARAGELVQVKIREDNFVYGSEPNDYLSDQPNVVDMTADAIIKLGNLPIAELRATVVLCEPDEWEGRFLRDRGDPNIFVDRIWGDIVSLRQTDNNDIYFFPIINEEEKLKDAVEELRLYAENGIEACDFSNMLARQEIKDRLLSRMAYFV